LRGDPRFNHCLAGMGLRRRVAGCDQTIRTSAS
jgi:hypothetical protein